MSTYTIGELAREFGVTARALRFYEDKGLLDPARDGQNRVYSARDRARLQLIVRGKRVGFSLVEIRQMLDLYDLGDNQRAQIRASYNKFQRQVKVLEQQREDIEGALEELHKGLAWMEERLAAAPDAESVESARAYEAHARASLDDDFDEPVRRGA